MASSAAASRAGRDRAVTVDLPDGRYRMYDPREDYRSRGMRATVIVTRRDPTVTERTVSERSSRRMSPTSTCRRCRSPRSRSRRPAGPAAAGPAARTAAGDGHAGRARSGGPPTTRERPPGRPARGHRSEREAHTTSVPPPGTARTSKPSASWAMSPSPRPSPGLSRAAAPDAVIAHQDVQQLASCAWTTTARRRPRHGAVAVGVQPGVRRRLADGQLDLHDRVRRAPRWRAISATARRIAGTCDGWRDRWRRVPPPSRATACSGVPGRRTPITSWRWVPLLAACSEFRSTLPTMSGARR